MATPTNVANKTVFISKAARGTDGRTYPWGDKFDRNKCNSYESGVNRTTPVSQYPDGVSPYGCYDMAGNVGEWCASWSDEKAGRWVSRGGSWFTRPVLLYVSRRLGDPADYRNNTLGFRLAQDLP
jgi:formylglycine-generating enzyme required for sulfatase activity